MPIKYGEIMIVHRVGSPNWLWSQLGYTVSRSGPSGVYRKVYDKNCALVCENVGHAEETRIATKLFNELKVSK